MAKARMAVEADKEIIVTIPLGDIPASGYEAAQAHAGKVSLIDRSVHIHANLGEAAATAFLRIRNGLRERNAKLGSGRWGRDPAHHHLRPA
jgi:hypothetical protein